jgi:hypothetical protein
MVGLGPLLPSGLAPPVDVLEGDIDDDDEDKVEVGWRVRGPDL